MMSSPLQLLMTLIESLCIELGLNTAHDYDGVKSIDDIDIYSQAIIREIRSLKERVKNNVPV